jgi:glutamate synthase domain-containing protein 3
MSWRERRKEKGEKGFRIDADGLHYRVLNEKIHRALEEGRRRIILDNVCGQRYIADALKGEDIEIVINGVPGNDLAVFMDGPRLVVKGNAQDGVGNTMNAGEVVIHGDAGDILGHSMRGGRIYVKGNVGYRVGIHMKAYQELFPVVVVGGTARDFLGEYMAGGLLVVLGLEERVKGKSPAGLVGDFIGTGMHGGSIFIRGEVDERCLGKEVKIAKPSEEDTALLKKYLSDFARHFAMDLDSLFKKPFLKLYPYSYRPYGKLYAY